MADIFLSYAREDLAKAKQLAAALENQGWSVFWDRTALLAGQDFEEAIEQAIEQAKCMIVAWSAASKRSDWVRGEADIGRKRKILVPILFEAVEPPIAFRAPGAPWARPGDLAAAVHDTAHPPVNAA